MSAIDSDQFSLRWNNFHSNMTTEFHALLQEEDLVDVTLAADGRFTQAHKIVLSVCSPYFKELFKINPCKHPIVILKDVGHKELSAILQFMYRGEVNVSQEDLTSFLKTAELLQIKGLTGDDSGKAPVQSPVPRSVHRGESSNSNTSIKPQNLTKPRLPSLALLDDYLRSPPPHKRPRSSDPVQPTLINNKMSTRTLEDAIDNSRSIKSEFLNFKEEPLDECDMEDGDIEQEAIMLSENGKSGHESLIQMVKGESSQNSSSQPEGFTAASAASLFASVSTLSLPQDSGGVQDISQDHEKREDRKFAWTVTEEAGYQSLYSLILCKLILFTSSQRTPVVCKYCNKTFTNLSNARIHFRDAHSEDGGPTVCLLCSKELKNKSCLRVHMYRNHGMYSPKSKRSSVNY